MNYIDVTTANMSVITISMSPELKAFFRFVGDAKCHDNVVDLDYALNRIGAFNEKAKKPFNQETLLKDCHVVARSRRNNQIAENEDDLTEIQKIRKQIEERKYQESVKNLKIPNSFSLKEEVKDMREAYILVSYFFVSFIGSFLFGYLSTNLFFSWRMEQSVFAGVVCAVFTLAVEVVLFVIRDQKKAMRKNKKSI